MSTSTKKKPLHETAPTTQQAPVSVPLPALVAYYAMPVPKGQRPIPCAIGGAIAHEDGEGFTLQLHLMPPVGAHIILRKPQVKKTA
jgi:hypothetical protein